MLVYQMWYVSEEGDDNDAYKYCHLLRVDYVSVTVPGSSHVSPH